MDVRFYTTLAGNSPVEKYLEGLEVRERAFLLDIFEDAGQRGLDSARVRVRQIEGKLWEIKASRHRIFFVMIAGPTMVLLHAYKKQGQRAPRAEIDVARRRLKEILDG